MGSLLPLHSKRAHAGLGLTVCEDGVTWKPADLTAWLCPGNPAVVEPGVCLSYVSNSFCFPCASVSSSFVFMPLAVFFF